MTKARSNATANAAKGDLTVGNGTNLSGVLAVGSNGDTIVADSSTSTGLRYTGGTVQANPVLNSSFQVWQRGTSIAQTAAIMYGADRWCSNRGGFDVGTTISRQATGDTTNLPNIQYAARVQRNSGTTSTQTVYFSQSIETVNAIPFIGKAVTFSFYARAGANYSSASNALSVVVATGTGTDQNILSTWTGLSSAIGGTQTATLTTTWQRFTYSGTANSSGTELGIYFNYTPVGTAGANDYFEITGVQLDIGSVALPFRTNSGTIQGELAACQRYYQRAANTTTYAGYGYGTARTTTQADIIVSLPVSMRVAPTAIDYSTLKLFNPGVASFTLTAITIDSASNTYVTLLPLTSGTLTQYRSYSLGNDGATGYLGFTAEL